MRTELWVREENNDFQDEGKGVREGKLRGSNKTVIELLCFWIQDGLLQNLYSSKLSELWIIKSESHCMSI